MSRRKIAIDPVTRLEGHLKVEVAVEQGKVVDAWMTGGMYRGFETILIGRHPRDASQIVQRICGVCPVAHGTAASLALEAAGKTEVPPGGHVARNLMLASNYLQSNILHFYHLGGQDYFRGPDTVPFIPRYQHPDLRLPPALNTLAMDEYLEALEVRQVCHELVALFGGRVPHVQGVLAGGAAEMPTREMLDAFAVRLQKVRRFVEQRYLPLAYRISSHYTDMFSIAHGYRNALCVGAFPLGDGQDLIPSGVYLEGKDVPFETSAVAENVKYSWFAPERKRTTPFPSGNEPEVNKPDAYSFIKAPTYAGKRVEVGPLARMWINNFPLSPVGQKALLETYGFTATRFRDLGEDRAFSVMGRILARAEEVWFLLDPIERWLQAIEPGTPTFVRPEVPRSGEGIGFTEAPRGSLIHYMRIRNSQIEDYAVIAASMWNCSPRDDAGQRGAVEEALIGVPVPEIDSPVNVGRVIRAFDP